MTTQDQGNGQQLLPQQIIERAPEVFRVIVATMCTDNCCHFDATDDDLQEALPAVRQLLAKGYFAGELQAQADNLDSDIWLAAAGEYSEAQERFAAAAEDYQRLSDVLERIFDRPLSGPCSEA